MQKELFGNEQGDFFPKRFFAWGILFLCGLIFSACSPKGQAQAVPATLTAVPAPFETRRTPTPFSTKVVTLEPILPSPTAALETQTGDSEAAVQNLNALLADYRQKIKTTGWIHCIYTFSFSANQQGVEVPPQIVEKWMRFDDTGRLVEAYDFNTSPEGKDMGGSALQNGQVTLIFYDGSVQHSTDDIPFTIDTLTNFYEAYLLKGNGSPLSQEAAGFHGVNAWKFSYHVKIPDAEFIEAIYFDKGTGLIVGYDTHQIQPDGSLKLHSGQTISDFEIDAKPPLERFQEILEKGKEGQ